jgi:circadian clock protein KaiB
MRLNPDTFVLRLYIAGQTPKCMRAFSNLERICEQYLADRYTQRVLAGLDVNVAAG